MKDERPVIIGGDPLSERTSIMHHAPHTPDHGVRIYAWGDVFVVCPVCGMHDWGDFGPDESAYTVEAFKAKYGDHVLSVETFENNEVELWTCAKCGEVDGYLEEHLTPARSDGTRGHLHGPFIDGEPDGTCEGPVNGPVKGY